MGSGGAEHQRYHLLNPHAASLPTPTNPSSPHVAGLSRRSCSPSHRQRPRTATMATSLSLLTTVLCWPSVLALPLPRHLGNWGRSCVPLPQTHSVTVSHRTAPNCAVPLYGSTPCSASRERGTFLTPFVFLHGLATRRTFSTHSSRFFPEVPPLLLSAQPFVI